jgi:hypothetical protein
MQRHLIFAFLISCASEPATGEVSAALGQACTVDSDCGIWEVCFEGTCAPACNPAIVDTPCDGPDGDSCNEGVWSCDGPAMVCSDTTATNVEICNGVDDDCDGQVDEGLGDCNWSVSTIDTKGGMNTSVGVDSFGTVQVSYYDPTSCDVRYASKPAGGSWKLQTLYQKDCGGVYPSLKIDSTNRAAIAFYDHPKKLLQYMTKPADGVWSLESSVPVTLGLYSSLTFDASNTPYMAYTDAPYLRVSKRQPDGTWSIGGITSGAAIGQSSLAIDPSGYSHLVYYDETNHKLVHGMSPYPLSRWIVPDGDVDADPRFDLGQYASLAIDRLGGLHVSYYEATYGVLKYAYARDGWSSWETAGVEVGVGAGTSCAVDAYGNIYIAYYDQTNGYLKLATKAPGGFWVTQAVDTAANVGEMPSLALYGPDVHITYFDRTYGHLKYATKAATAGGGGGGGGHIFKGY